MESGEPRAAEQLLALVYNELRRLAAAKMARERPGHTLQPTALVHEAWLRLGGDAQPAWQNRRHFFGAAAEAMRRVLIGNARRKHAARRGLDVQHLDIDAPEIEIATPVEDEELLRVHDALIAWPSKTRARPSWSNCAISSACRSKRRPRPWAFPTAPRNAIGPMRGPGSVRRLNACARNSGPVPQADPEMAVRIGDDNSSGVRRKLWTRCPFSSRWRMKLQQTARCLDEAGRIHSC